jgi:hypothetical protein
VCREALSAHDGYRIFTTAQVRDEETRKKRGMHSRKEIEPVLTSMTGQEPGSEEEAARMDGDEFPVGGIEVYARIVEEAGKPGVDFTCGPVIHDREIPEGIAEYNRAIEEMCRATVMKFTDPRSLGRFYREVKKDGVRNRCWYRVTVTARVGAGGQITGRVTDAIDPALVRADPPVKFRARQLRAMLQRGMGDA